MLVKQMVKVTKKIRNLVQSEVRIQNIQNDLQIYRQMFRLNMKRSSKFIKIFSEYGNLSFTSQCSKCGKMSFKSVQKIAQ
jgi:uncharacterized protein YjgD (DUF1641 family)